MIKVIEMHQTPDGKMHESRDEAVSHIENSCCEAMQSIINLHNKGSRPDVSLNHKQYISLIDFIVGDIDDARLFVRELSKILGE